MWAIFSTRDNQPIDSRRFKGPLAAGGALNRHILSLSDEQRLGLIVSKDWLFIDVVDE